MNIKRLHHPLLICVTVLAMNASQAEITATLTDLRWMQGAWQGELGEQFVEEAWSKPTGGTMSTMVRLTTATAILMIELIAIREHDGTLILHLRQFTPDLQPVLAQDMPLAAITDTSVSFTGPADSRIKGLRYRKMGDQGMAVDVTVSDNQVLTAELTRQSP